MNSSFCISSFLKNLSTLPGVYQMLNDAGDVIYVGKAKNLKNRVSSYFKQSNQSAKTQSLVAQIASISITVTHSETEALLLESNLIKRLKPKYNILLRDDKSYPYVMVTVTHQFPRIDIVRLKSKPKQGMHFGPYPSVGAVKETLNLLQKIFKLRNCRDSNFKSRTRACLQYQIKRCSGPCVGLIDEQQYQQSVKDAIAFLSGKSRVLIEKLENEMDEASQQLDFEAAALYRDQIRSLRQVQEQQYINQGDDDLDVIAVEMKGGVAGVQLLSIRAGQVIANQSFFPKIPSLWMHEIDDEAQLHGQIFEAFISQYTMQHEERIPPQIITTVGSKANSQLAEALSQLANKTCKIYSKCRGVRVKWLELAKKNLQIATASHLASKTKIQERYLALQKVLDLPEIPKRMECFDISHTLGEATVASCVVFNEEGPLTSDYRRFNIEGITPGDDYAAMKQALTRRYKRLKQGQNKLPDILFIDGGKGQVTQAQEVFKELGISKVALIGVAKGPDRKAGWETLLLSDSQQQLSLPMDSPALHLIQHIRDESHRFAITAHRQKRHKARFES